MTDGSYTNKTYEQRRALGVEYRRGFDQAIEFVAEALQDLVKEIDDGKYLKPNSDGATIAYFTIGLCVGTIFRVASEERMQRAIEDA